MADMLKIDAYLLQFLCHVTFVSNFRSSFFFLIYIAFQKLYLNTEQILNFLEAVVQRCYSK